MNIYILLQSPVSNWVPQVRADSTCWIIIMNNHQSMITTAVGDSLKWTLHFLPHITSHIGTNHAQGLSLHLYSAPYHQVSNQKSNKNHTWCICSAKLPIEYNPATTKYPPPNHLIRMQSLELKRKPVFKHKPEYFFPIRTCANSDQ